MFVYQKRHFFDARCEKYENFISIHQMDGGNSVKNKPYCFKEKVLNYVIKTTNQKLKLWRNSSNF